MRTLIKSGVFILTFSFFFLSHIRANESQPICFDNYDADQGLIHNYVLSIFQDSRGILWVGTYGGVQEFDGYHFNLFDVSGKKSNILSNQVVNVIYEDRKHNIWFGTENGLNRYNLHTGQITRYFNQDKNPHSLSHNNIRTIYQDKQGLFWIGTYGGGLNKFDAKRGVFEQYKARPGDSTALQSNLVNSVFVDKHGLLWIGTENGGISVFDRSKNQVIRNFEKGPGQLSSATVNTIYQDEDENYWIGTWDGGLDKYDPHSRKFSTFAINVKSGAGSSANNIRSIVQTEKDFLWIGTFGQGLYKFDLKDERFTRIDVQSDKEANSSQDLIWTLYRDVANRLWFGTFGMGLFKENKLRNTFPYTVLKPVGEDKLSISTMVQDRTGTLWIGTLNRGIYLYDLTRHTYKRYRPDRIKDESIGKIYLDRENRIWIGVDAALYEISSDRKTIRKFSHDPDRPSSISESEVNSILEDRHGNLWIGFWGTGIDVIRHRELQKKNPDDVVFAKYMTDATDTASFQHYRIWNLYEDSQGTIWIGTSGKLAYYTPDDKTFKTLPISVASSFYEDRYGYLWIGSIGNGLYKLDKNRQILKKYGVKDGLPCLDVLAILPDTKGRLWLGTSSGLSVFDPQSENISNYDKNYGLQSFSIIHNACLLLKSGKMVFGGNNGFNMFVPEDISQDFNKSPIYITDIKLNNKSVAYENVMDSSALLRSSVADLDTLRLSYKNKVLTINFAAANYSIPTGITYAYKLEGFDPDWVVTDAYHRSATYTNLDDGRYTFRIKMSYNNQKWIENSRKLCIIIMPPFWKRLWFKILILLSVSVLIWIIVSTKLGRLKLVMLVNQKHIITEKLSKEQEIMRLKNQQLIEAETRLNKKMAILGLKYQSLIDFLSSVYQNLVDVRASLPLQKTDKINHVLKSMDEKISDVQTTVDFNNSIDTLYDDFLTRLAEAYPKLSPTDLRICAFVRMNKSNKEIARKLSITQGSLETSRHRIRKKMDLPTSVSLNDFMLRY